MPPALPVEQLFITPHQVSKAMSPNPNKAKASIRMMSPIATFAKQVRGAAAKSELSGDYVLGRREHLSP